MRVGPTYWGPPSCEGLLYSCCIGIVQESNPYSQWCGAHVCGPHTIVSGVVRELCKGVVVLSFSYLNPVSQAIDGTWVKSKHFIGQAHCNRSLILPSLSWGLLMIFFQRSCHLMMGSRNPFHWQGFDATIRASNRAQPSIEGGPRSNRRCTWHQSTI
jgi:hypothetical protein